MMGPRAFTKLVDPRGAVGFMRSFGRALQIIGLAVLPLGSILQLASAITLGQMLTMLVAGACVFGIGTILQGYTR